MYFNQAAKSHEAVKELVKLCKFHKPIYVFANNTN